MNVNSIEGKWHQLKGEARTQWAKLTNDDIAMVGGQMEVLIGRIQERYGYERERAQREVDAFLTRHASQD